VALAVQGRTRGLEVGKFHGHEDPVPIVLRSQAGEAFPVRNLASIDVAAPGGKPAPLGQLARSFVEWLPAVIKHRDRERLVTVFSQVKDGSTSSRVLNRLKPELASMDLPPGIRIEYGGQAEASGEANLETFKAMPPGIMVLVLVLLAQFNSFRRVAIILVTVPLAVTGIVPGLLLSGQAFGFMSLLGVIALVGIVVNNAIVLIDRIEIQRRKGDSIPDAIVQAVRVRTRPVLLTTATTVCGLLPLAFSGSTLWPPMAWAMISGLIASTGLTLLVVPSLYKLLFPSRTTTTFGTTS
jgi:multidrug efflux pump subunit AcrB